MSALPMPSSSSPLLMLMRAFAMLGIEASASEVAEACKGDYSPDSLALRLRERGVLATVVRIDASDVTALEAPALVGMRDETVALVTGTSRRYVTLLRESGAHVRVGVADLASALGRYAIVMTGGHREAGPGGLLGRVRRAVVRSPSLRRNVGLAVLLAAAMQLLGLAGPLVSWQLFDSVLPDAARQWLGAVAAATLLLGAHAAWAGWLRDTASRHIEARLRMSALSGTFADVLHTPFADLQRRTTGELARAVDCADTAVTGLVQIATVALEAVFGIAYLAVVIAFVPQAGFAIALLSAGLVALGAVYGRALGEIDAKLLEASYRQRDALHEMLVGVETLKIVAAERTGIARWLGRFIDEQALALDRQDAAARFHAIAQLTGQVAVVALLGWGGHECLQHRLSLGALLAAVQACVALVDDVAVLAEIPLRWGVLRSQVNFANRAAPSGASAGAGAPPPTSIAVPDEAVVLEDVWFRHAPDAPWILRGFSMRVKRGEVMRVSWPSGAGKTTLLRLIAGLYVPERGLITLAGRDPRSARQLVGYLPQATFLFHGSILDNLRILSGGADFERLVAAARLTGLADVVRGWPMGLDTMLVPYGANLSAGQRQLVAVTGLAASHRPILLLDEAFAHIDRIAQARLEGAAIFAGRTVVTVAHDQAPVALRA